MIDWRKFVTNWLSRSQDRGGDVGSNGHVPAQEPQRDLAEEYRQLRDLPTDKLVYLASPYSDLDPAVMELRFQEAARAAAYLMRRGLVIYSPIAHTHPIAQYGLPKGWAFWKQFDDAFMDVCMGGLVVLKLDGWQESQGVTAEIAYMRRKGRPIEYLDPKDMEGGR